MLNPIEVQESDSGRIQKRQITNSKERRRDEETYYNNQHVGRRQPDSDRLRAEQ